MKIKTFTLKRSIGTMVLLVLLGGTASWGQHIFDEPQMIIHGAFAYRQLTDSTVEFLGHKDNCTPAPREWVIPDTIEVGGNVYTVTRIGELAFYGQIINSIVLPPTITEIADEGFFSVHCTSIVLPESVTKIGNQAFGYSNFTSLHIPAGVTEIGDGILYKSEIASITLDSANRTLALVDGVLYNGDTTVMLACPKTVNRDTLVLPATVQSIPYGTMAGCNTLMQVDLPGGLRHIGTEALPPSLLDLYIPPSVERIDGRPIAGQPVPYMTFSVDPLNTHYRSVDGQLTNAEGDTLLMVVGARGEYTVPDGVRVLGEAIFRECRLVTSVLLPEGLTNIGKEAFMSNYCTVNLPSTLTSIGESAFHGDKAIGEVVLPPSLRTVGESAYQESSITSLVVSDSVTHIGDYAFKGTNSLRSIVLGRSVESIGAEAFYVTRLNGDTVTFPPSLRTLGYQAFRYSGIARAIFEGAVDTIGAYCLPSKVVRFASSVPPVMFMNALMLPDTVYIPCGATEDYRQNSMWNSIMNYQEDCSSISTPERKNPAFTLAPNPATGKVRVGIHTPPVLTNTHSSALTGTSPNLGEESHTTLTLRDAAGHEVMHKTLPPNAESVDLDLSNLPAGAYFVTLSTPASSATQRLVVK